MGFKNFFYERLSLMHHGQLNPKLWQDGVLKPAVLDKLLAIADAWRTTARIPKAMVQDVIMTGGNANFFYTPSSDIDVHLVIDRAKLFDGGDFVDDYLTAKKALWSLTHKIDVVGYQVEVYAQDSNDKLAASGVYSLTKNKWLKRPVDPGDIDFEKDTALINKVQGTKDLIDSMIAMKLPSADFKDLKNKLRDMRNEGLANGDELSFGNLVFKSLRNDGYLDKMNVYLRQREDDGLSLH